jgi:hypothetical protein
LQPAEVGAEHPDRAKPAGAKHLKPAGQEDVVVDAHDLGAQGGAGVVAHPRPAAVQ